MGGCCGAVKSEEDLIQEAISQSLKEEFTALILDEMGKGNCVNNNQAKSDATNNYPNTQVITKEIPD